MRPAALGNARWLFLAIPIAMLGLAGGCGNSHHGSSAASSTPATTATSSSPSTTATSSSPSTTATSTASSSTSTTTTALSGSSNARVPARFLVHSGGRLTPPEISVPGSLPIELTVISRDGRSHHLALGSPPVKRLRVPAAGQATTLIRHLRNGHYPLMLDGADAGALVVGVAVGP